MKWIVKRNNLLDELQLVNKVIDNRSSRRPILSNFFIQAYVDYLKIAATDLELSYESFIPATVDVPGKIILPIKTVINICKTFTEEEFTAKEVVFEFSEPSHIILKSGLTHYDVLCFDVDDYPIPNIPTPSDNVFTIPTSLLKQAIDYVRFAIPKDTGIPALLGVLFHKELDVFHAVATDGFRLPIFMAPIEKESNDDFTFLVHYKAIEQLKETIRKMSLETVKFYKIGDLIIFELGNRKIAIRSIDDKFPDYHVFIPQDASFRIQTCRKPLLNICKRIKNLARSIRDIPEIKFIPDGEYHLILQYRNPDIGTIRDKIKVVFEGDPFPIYLNGNFIIDFLNVIQSKYVEFWLNSPSEPVAIQPVVESSILEYRYFYVVMPIKHENEIKD